MASIHFLHTRSTCKNWQPALSHERRISRSRVKTGQRKRNTTVNDGCLLAGEIQSAHAYARAARGIRGDAPGAARARIELAGAALTGTMDVDLALHETLAAWVPVTMTETWRARGQRTTGFAEYDRFQRLTVSTGEIVK